MDREESPNDLQHHGVSLNLVSQSWLADDERASIVNEEGL